MAQFIIGFAAGVYIGTHYNCRPGLRLASDTLEQYCPKREPTDHYVPINVEDKVDKKEEPKEEKKSIEMTSALKKWF